ncbi:MAG: VacJ family lipoprotein [Hyphomicrobiales bacterium]|nr:VacJ family lipoprotein [Hyphomicrobiales bacterium]
MIGRRWSAKICIFAVVGFLVAGQAAGVRASEQDFDPYVTPAPENVQVAAQVAVPGTVPGTVEVAAAGDATDDVNDPLEPLNRAILHFNNFFEVMLLRPATTFWVAFVPPPLREAIGNMLDNLKTPVVLANDLLQGEGDRALITVKRFFINSTVGIGGIRDYAADEMNMPGHDEDFGQTLAVWGVGEGLYVVLPFFGPSNPRDAVGKLVVDPFFDPLGLYLANTNQDAWTWTRTGTGATDEFSGVADELDQIKKTSVDFYAALRSMYRQKRAAEIRNGSDDDLPPIPDIKYDVSEEDEKGPVEAAGTGGTYEDRARAAATQ